MNNIPLIPPVGHGGPNQQPFRGLDFSVNINPYGPNPLLLQAMLAADHAHYPDPSYWEVRQALAKWHDTSTKQIALGLGSSELMQRLARIYLNSQRPLVSLYAPFGEMQRAAQLMHSKVQVANNWQQLTALVSGAGLIYIGQPHNPTGRYLNQQQLHSLAQLCQPASALVVLDLAYAPFVADIPILQHTAVVALYSAGKAHGLLGVRPAYAIANAEIVEQLDNLAPAWQLPSGTAAVLAKLPEAGEFLRRTLPLLRSQAIQLAAQLEPLGEVEHHDTPYLTLTVKQADQVAHHLLEQGFKVRDCSSYLLPQRLRISSRGPADDRQLITALQQVLQKSHKL